MFSLIAVSAELAEQLIAIETGGEDAVHQARTRVRRLRSILGVYRRAFDAGPNGRMRERLKDLGDRLGAVRDLEVRAEALESLLRAEDRPDVVDATQTLADEATAEHEKALAVLLRHLRGRTHRRLLADLQLYAAEPPLRDAERGHLEAVTGTGLKKAVKRVRASRGDSLEERHATRKAARRLRYAAEAVADDRGRDAVRLAAAAEAVHDALGENRDHLLLARFLREHGQTGLAQRSERLAAQALDGLEEKLEAVRL